MRNTAKRVIQSLRHARRFLDEEPLGSNPRIVGARKRLDETIRTLEQAAVRQDAAELEGRSDSARLETLRRTLRARHLRPLVRAGRAALGKTGGDAAQFRLLPGRTHTESLLAAAGGLREAAVRHKQLLVDSGMHEGFIEELDAAAAELRATLVHRGTNVRRRAGATAELEDAAADGRRMLMLLDAVLTRELHDDPERLAEWRSASRVRRPAAPPAPQAPATV